VLLICTALLCCGSAGCSRHKLPLLLLLLLPLLLLLVLLVLPHG